LGEKMNELLLITGLPGSGNSTKARAMSGYRHFEADMFFMVNGVYVYDKEKIQDAHAWCLAQAKSALEKGENVVVANTFIKKWEMAPYLKLGYPTRVEVAKWRYDNIHGVSLEALERMRLKWEGESLPPIFGAIRSWTPR
jgi:predicted kinase